jgi:uncharacterized protein YndB with AHSA1/START domain
VVNAPLTFTVELSAPAVRVFAALTEGRHLARWFCDACESDPVAGGRLVMHWHGERASREPYEARWTALVAPTTAAFHGGHAGYPGGDAGEVTFELEEDATGTRLTVRHALPGEGDYAPMVAAWQGAWPRALARLSGYLSPTA